MSGNNLTINGAGQATGGKYGSIAINGAGTINGDVECDSMVNNGAATINGGIISHSVEFNGASSIKGKLESKFIRANGSCTINGETIAENITVAGAMNARENIKSEKIEVTGMINADKDCESEKFILKGGIKIGGMLNAGEISIVYDGDCGVKEIGGDTIMIKEGDIFLNTFLETILSPFIKAKKNRKMTIDTIEGDDINLSDVIVRVVRGRKVIIGNGCEIDTIEYNEECQVNANAKVQNSIKIT
jgi:cytoskeletal protein CcmA (bactofilin family)